MIGYINVFIFSRTLAPYLTQKKGIKDRTRDGGRTRDHKLSPFWCLTMGILAFILSVLRKPSRPHASLVLKLNYVEFKRLALCQLSYPGMY